MTESEQKRILDLLAEGKLSVDDAERLLSALSGSGDGRTAGPAPTIPTAPRPTPPPSPESRGGRVAGFNANDLANFALIGITPEYIERMRETGLKGLNASQLQGLQPLGVTPEYVKEMQALGVKDLNAGTVQGMFAVGVTSAFVRKWKEAGFESLSSGELTNLCVSGTSPELAARMRRALEGPTDQRAETPAPSESPVEAAPTVS